ncbi:hypothetical protein [Nocardioides lijunqiniae]|uniref:hypothetical protein n=1 Tax=Nocardioides lijunqiniae TaxID=2760832 RepID=UPI001877EF83|nr:hypothetical protein [Nocardioides lijunqiniae]
MTDEQGSETTAPRENGPTLPLSTFWLRRSEFSGHASTHVRTSALAGLGVAWLFAGGTDGDLSTLATAPKGLLIAAAIFAASLGADILQYFVGAQVYRSLARHYEKQDYAIDDLVPNPPWAPLIPAIFYNLKVVLLFGGYTVLVVVFLRAL